MDAVGDTFLFLFGEMFLLFIGISFLVALLQIYVSKQKIQKILTTPRKSLNSILGAALGAVTPFCSCSTVPILVGLIKSGVPFSGIMSFLLTSPILNPAIIALFLTSFGVPATLLYSGFTFVFAVVAGLVLDKLGFGKRGQKGFCQGRSYRGCYMGKPKGYFKSKTWLGNENCHQGCLWTIPWRGAFPTAWRWYLSLRKRGSLHF